MVVRGHDRHKRAVFMKMARQAPSTDEQAYFLAQLYLLERAIAATEVTSRGTQEKVTVIFDFYNYSSSNSPPFTTVRKTLNLLQRFYPERLAKLLILDPPFWVRGVYAAVSPLLAPETRERITLVTGTRASSSEERASSSEDLGSDTNGDESRMSARDLLVAELIDPSQAMPLLISCGKLKGDIDICHFMHNVPFHSLYDSV
jgi:CRAL/TRIO domain